MAGMQEILDSIRTVVADEERKERQAAASGAQPGSDDHGSAMEPRQVSKALETLKWMMLLNLGLTVALFIIVISLLSRLS